MMRAPAGTEHAVAGAFAGVVGTVLGSPLDTIKTRLQAEAKAGGSSRMLPVARSIYRQEGVRGFYRGLAPPLAALTILNTLSFSSYSAAKRVLGVEKVLPVIITLRQGSRRRVATLGELGFYDTAVLNECGVVDATGEAGASDGLRWAKFLRVRAKGDASWDGRGPAGELAQHAHGARQGAGVRSAGAESCSASLSTIKTTSCTAHLHTASRI
jgi:hypothetical protein